MQTARVIAALAIGAVAGEFFATPLSRFFEAPFGDQAGFAAAIALPLAVAGVGAILAGLTARQSTLSGREQAPLPDLYIGGHQPGRLRPGEVVWLRSEGRVADPVGTCQLRDPATGRFTGKA